MRSTCTLPVRKAHRRPYHLFDVLEQAGIRVNTMHPRSWDIEVYNVDLFCRRINSPWKNGLTELGDMYVEGVWDCSDISGFYYRCLKARLNDRLRWNLPNVLHYWMARLFNQQTRRDSARDISRHYNLGSVFQAMLGSTMTYSCAYWKDAVFTLHEAQIAKHALACRKLELHPSMKILDIGSGWGAFLKYAAENYGIDGHGISLSTDQVRYANSQCIGLPIRFELRDYRDMEEEFDGITSFGMFEHVGPKNYHSYFKKVHSLLRSNGLFLFHTFGCITPAPTLRTPEVEWINRHIFPGLVNPSFGQIATASDRLFTILDVQEFGTYYYPTLKAWSENFVRGWPSIRDQYDERFFRTWLYYLEICAAAFHAGNYRVWQVVFGKDYSEVYEAAR